VAILCVVIVTASFITAFLQHYSFPAAGASPTSYEGGMLLDQTLEQWLVFLQDWVIRTGQGEYAGSRRLETATWRNGDARHARL